MSKKSFSFPLFLFLTGILPLTVLSQHISPTTASERLKGFGQKNEMEPNATVESLDFISIGPTIMSGRVTDVDVKADNPDEFYAAYASGGLWKTSDRGKSFSPLFDHEATMSMGDVAVDWKHGETIWLGTGENNSSRSSYAGLGIYKSIDKGESWEHVGLEESFHIGRIVLHPENPDIVWVAAMGHLFTRNPERGIYKTTDGGRTWKQTLFVNDKTGAIDLVVNPRDPSILYAAMWERQAWMWDRHESGAGSGIYKSTDGGETWENISSKDHGFPTGKYVGRIGIDIYPGNPDILYAYLDNKTPVEPKEKKKESYEIEDLRNMSVEEFNELDPRLFKKFLKKSKYPKSLSYDSLKRGMEAGLYTPPDFLAYRMDTNYVPEPRTLGVEIYRTDNGGQSWYRTHQKNFKGPLMRYSYGYYFGEIRVFPDDPDKIIVGGLVVSISKNGGKKLKRQIRTNVHLDHHAFWINPKDPDFVLNGNDGGLNLSTNGGRKWEKINPIAVGQFYTVMVDNAEPYNVYGGLQDNGVWMGPSTYDLEAGYERKRKKYPYKRLYGGDGMQVQVADQGADHLVYTGSQYGNYRRITLKPKKDGTYKRKRKKARLRPGNEFGLEAHRFNWQTPILLSPHSDSVFYMGSQRVNRSTRKGSGLVSVSDDLPRTWKKGDGPNATITCIDESPLEKGVIYAGTDDGLVWVSGDNCETWEDVSGGLPSGFRVYSIDASAFSKGRAYVALKGYYSDNFESHIYKTEDYGKSWTRISSNLYMDPVNKILEDPVNENLLYVGTDNGLFISLDRGTTYHRANSSLPHVPVHDLVVHPRELDLLVGTHGRSIYKASVKKLQEAANEGR